VTGIGDIGKGIQQRHREILSCGMLSPSHPCLPLPPLGYAIALHMSPNPLTIGTKYVSKYRVRA
jgi:hypothetical protein